MACVTAEFEYVMLRNSHVFEYSPSRTRQMFNLLMNRLGWKIFNDRLEIYVRAASAQDVKQMLTKRLILIHHGLLPDSIKRIIGFPFYHSSDVISLIRNEARDVADVRQKIIAA